MLIHELEHEGEWLFRWRSYLPLLLAPLAIWEISTHHTFLGESRSLDLAYKVLCLLIALAGISIRLAVHGWALEGSSGRDTRGQRADLLNVTGLYSVMRHPLYVGNTVIVTGIMLFTKSVPITAIGVLAMVLMYERIIVTEEKFLAEKFGEAYLAWARSTPALWPRRKHWTQPDVPFSWRCAWREEFYGLLVIATALLFLDTLDTLFIEHVLAANSVWIIFFTLSVVAFLVLRYLRKNTRYLDRVAPVREEVPLEE